MYPSLPVSCAKTGWQATAKGQSVFNSYLLYVLKKHLALEFQMVILAKWRLYNKNTIRTLINDMLPMGTKSGSLFIFKALLNIHGHHLLF